MCSGFGSGGGVRDGGAVGCRSFMDFLGRLKLSRFNVSIIVTILVTICVLIGLFRFFFRGGRAERDGRFSVLGGVVSSGRCLRGVDSGPCLVERLFFAHLCALGEFRACRVSFLLSRLSVGVGLCRLGALGSLRLVRFVSGRCRLGASPVGDF